MSRERIREEAGQLSRPGSEVRCHDEGDRVVVVLSPYSPPDEDAYSPSEVEALAFIVPVPYPDAQPDASGFYVKPVGLRLASGGSQPQSTAQTHLLGEPWLKFSWAPKGPQWDPTKDTLETYLATLEKRFRRRN